jgi:hypothetical protein
MTKTYDRVGPQHALPARRGTGPCEPGRAAAPAGSRGKLQEPVQGCSEARTPTAITRIIADRARSRVAVAATRVARRRSSGGSAADITTRWLLFCVRFVHEQVSWQTPGALSPDLEDLL